MKLSQNKKKLCCVSYCRVWSLLHKPLKTNGKSFTNPKVHQLRSAGTASGCVLQPLSLLETPWVTTMTMITTQCWGQRDKQEGIVLAGAAAAERTQEEPGLGRSSCEQTFGRWKKKARGREENNTGWQAMNLIMPLNCTLRDGWDGRFYMFILIFTN